MSRPRLLSAAHMPVLPESYVYSELVEIGGRQDPLKTTVWPRGRGCPMQLGPGAGPWDAGS